MELRQRVTVGVGGEVVLTLPESTAGEIVDVTVLFDLRRKAGRKAGSLKGKIHVGPEFDEPIPGMEAYE